MHPRKSKRGKARNQVFQLYKSTFNCQKWFRQPQVENYTMFSSLSPNETKVIGVVFYIVVASRHHRLVWLCLLDTSWAGSDLVTLPSRVLGLQLLTQTWVLLRYPTQMLIPTGIQRAFPWNTFSHSEQIIGHNPPQHAYTKRQYSLVKWSSG